MSEPEKLIVRPEDRGGLLDAVRSGVMYSPLAKGSQTAGGYYLSHATVLPGGGPPPHIHTREEEAFYIVRGGLTFLLDDEEVEAESGTFLHVPRGRKHRFLNLTDEEAEVVFWFTPPGIEAMFEEISAHPDDITRIGEKYGTRYFLDA